MGLGRHVVELDLKTVSTLTKVGTGVSSLKPYLPGNQLEIALAITWAVAITAVKISILDLYSKIFRVKWFLSVVWGFIIIQVLLCVAILLQVFLICRPFALWWNRTLDGICGDQIATYLSAHIMVLIFDFSIAVLPVPVLWGLRMATGKKIGISFLFSIGIL